MGLERKVTFPSGVIPDWKLIVAKFKELEIVPVLRMIDGQLAFPDEQPEANWSELRLGLPGGMVTLRREGASVRCLVWGNADAAMLMGRDQCCWVVAAAGEGTVVDDEGFVISQEEFRSRLG